MDAGEKGKYVMKWTLSLLFMGFVLQLFNMSFATTLKNYDYVYETPSKQSITTNGWFVISSSRCVYAASPSKHKNARHRNMTTAYNRQYGNY